MANTKPIKKENKQVDKAKNLVYNSVIKDALNESLLSQEETLEKYNSSLDGLNEEQVEKSIDKYGYNEISKHKDNSTFLMFIKAFATPFSILLIVVAVISIILQFIPDSNGEISTDRGWYITPIIIIAIVLISGIMRFVQDKKSLRSTNSLKQFTDNTSTVIREGKIEELSNDKVVVGDMIRLGAGDLIPADIRILSARDFFVDQKALTGESDSIEKESINRNVNAESIFDISNFVYKGSCVVSGTATAIVLKVGENTILGKLAIKVSEKKEKTAFDKGIDSVTKLLLGFMAVMVPLVFIFRGLAISQIGSSNWIDTIKDASHWLETFVFAVSIAVGLTPALLPMQVASDLSKGAVNMSKKEVIVKDINSIQNFGAMDILCTDKTGTLTEGNSTVSEFLNYEGESKEWVMNYAYLNSSFQTGIRNQLDKTIIEYMDTKPDDEKDLMKRFIRLDEVPFDFDRKMLSILVKDKLLNKNVMITKGFPGTVKDKIGYIQLEDKIRPATKEDIIAIKQTAEDFGALGCRVILVAMKYIDNDTISKDDESNMIFLGYMTFKDAPKLSVMSALKNLRRLGVRVKVLTGDNLAASLALCKSTGFGEIKSLSGPKIAQLTDEELKVKVEECDLFVKLSPEDKQRIVRVLKLNNHTVGFMGDGINDASALKEADVGISFKDATDIAKEAADMILLENDLDVLADGIIEGRKSYNNMMKYLKGQTSSNFGNMCSQLIGSLWIPFIPMAPVMIILLDIVTDVSCAIMPMDQVDEELTLNPCRFSVKEIRSFMFMFGPLSSLIDLITFAILLYFIAPMQLNMNFATAYSFGLESAQYLSFVAIFQTGFFIESLVTQNAVYAILRTEKIPFIQSRPSTSFGFAIMLSILIGFFLVYVPKLQDMFSFASWETNTEIEPTGLGGPLSGYFVLIMIGLVFIYLLGTQLIKSLFKKKYGRLL